MTNSEIGNMLSNARRYAGLDIKTAAHQHGLRIGRIRAMEAGHGGPAATVLTMLESYGLEIRFRAQKRRPSLYPK